VPAESVLDAPVLSLIAPRGEEVAVVADMRRQDRRLVEGDQSAGAHRSMIAVDMSSLAAAQCGKAA
jgi:hypothetical protein